MKRLFVWAVLGLFAAAPAMFADVVDYMLNINGTTYCPSGTGATCSSLGGLAAAGATGTLDTSFGGTGLGTVDLSFTTPGTYNVGLWLFEELVPASGYDEYGAVSVAPPAPGVSWQIDVPDYNYNAITDPNFGGLPAGAGSIIGNTTANTLSNTNYLPGTTDSFLNLCSASPNCNDYTSMALGESFTLPAGFKELVSFNVSTTAPRSGFYLEQIDPGITGTPATYFYSVSTTQVPVCTVDCNTVPEPSAIIPEFVFLCGAVLWLAIRRRSTVVRGQ
jgi:hypothetical protein